MKLLIKIFVILGLCILSTACPPPNSSPVISSINLNKGVCIIGETVECEVVAFDPEGDSLDITWSLSAYGSILQDVNNPNRATFTSGPSTGTAIITVHVSDSINPSVKETAQIVITEGDAPPPRLSGLSVTNYSISFNEEVFTYAISVAEDIYDITVNAVLEDTATTTLTINGDGQTSGVGKIIHLSAGSNTINFIVTNTSSSESVNYSLNVNKAADTNSDLSGLDISGASISFNSNITSYSVNFNTSIESTVITPNADSPGAVIRVNGQIVNSGFTSNSIILSYGSNTITVEITAEDGITIKNYTITATRDYPIPETPNGLSLTSEDQRGDDSIEMEWASVNYATTYKLYVDGSFYWEGSATSTSVTGLDYGKNYNFQVSALNNSGESSLSGIVTEQTIPRWIVYWDNPQGPYSNSPFSPGDQILIKFNGYSDLPIGTVKLVLCDNYTVKYTIITSINGSDREYTYTLPADLTLATDYRIWLYDRTWPNAEDYSDQFIVE